jgi:ABC-type transport system, involved in lipoprotein release, permease component
LLWSEWLQETGTASMGIGRTFVNAEMKFNPVIFLNAFLRCLALNLLSAGIPAWRASRMRIISALNENVH